MRYSKVLDSLTSDLNKEFGLKFLEDYQFWKKTPEEDQRVQQPKHCK